MNNFESFYGGRQGNSIVIVKRFDAIDATKKIPVGLYAKDPSDVDKYYIDYSGDLVEKNAGNYKMYQEWGSIPKDGKHGVSKTTKKVIEDVTDLPADSYVLVPAKEIEGMVQCFAKGGLSTSEVGYGEYVIIDTIGNLKEQNDPDNGKIFRRGFDYTNTEALCGAEYIGQIVGPRGSSPSVDMASVKTITSTDPHETGYYAADDTDLETGDLVPGYYVDATEGEKYNDKITYAWSDILDSDGNIIGAKIGFRFPYLVPKILFQIVSPYDEITGEKIPYSEFNKDLDPLGTVSGHPFYRKWDFKIPGGIKGNSFKSVYSVPMKIRIGSNYYSSRESTEPVGQITEEKEIDFDDFYNTFIKNEVTITENSKVKINEESYYVRVYDLYENKLKYSILNYDEKEEGNIDWQDIEGNADDILEITLVVPPFELPADVRSKIESGTWVYPYPTVGHLIALYKTESTTLKITQNKYSYYSNISGKVEDGNWVDIGYAKGEAGGLHIITQEKTSPKTISEYIEEVLGATPPEERYGDNTYRGWAVSLKGKTSSESLEDSVVIVSYDYPNQKWFQIANISDTLLSPSGIIILDTSTAGGTPVNYEEEDLPVKDGIWLVESYVQSAY